MPGQYPAPPGPLLCQNKKNIFNVGALFVPGTMCTRTLCVSGTQCTGTPHVGKTDWDQVYKDNMCTRDFICKHREPNV